MEKVRVGIIGCGGIANWKHMPALHQLEDVEMVAFCDLVVSKAEEAKNKYGTPDAAVYEDYKKLLEDKTIDVVHVLTPNRAHSFITVDALEAGKHVMCEKPMAINSAEAKKMLDAAERTGKKLTIGYQNRQSSQALYLRQEAQKGRFGEIYFAKATAIRRHGVPGWGVFLNEYEQGGGPLIDIGTHALDLTLWTMDNYKPKYCVGTSYQKLNNERYAKGSWDPAKYTVEDSAFGFVVMENGATIIVESAWALNTLETREAVTYVCGTEGGADLWDGLRINGFEDGKPFEERPQLTPDDVVKYRGYDGDDPCVREARQWINSVLDDKDPCVLPKQAYCVTQILEGIYTSAKTGEVYYFNK